MGKKSLKVLFLAAEAVPFAKVGGLADVAGSLPKAIQALGHDVRLMIPRYGTIRSDQFQLEKIGDPFPIPVGPGQERVHLIGTTVDGEAGKDLPVYLIWSDLYFSSRDRIYGFEDDAQRFAVFGRAALAALRILDWKPDVIHANDWHTGIVPTWLSTDGQKDPFYKDIATLFTIHNLAYQGITGRLILTFAQMEYVQHLPVEEPGMVNWMAQGIAHADLINAVSQQYSREIPTPEMGMGLAPLLKQRENRLFGVLNGIDYDQWNPATDRHIPHRFDADTLDRRTTNKTALVGMVTQLDEVKGMDLMEPVLEWLLEKEAQFILLGTGEHQYHEMFAKAQARFPNRMRAFLKVDDVLARRVYAGADLFLMPSAVEPCGTAQMIAMRYGCVPVVSTTGGLVDTVIDYTTQRGHSTGFAFTGNTPEACQDALDRALQTYQRKRTWRGMQRRGMALDFSWSASAKQYVKLYQQAMSMRET